MKQATGTQPMKDKTSALMPIAPRPDTLCSRSWLSDRQGHRYLDFVQGWAVNTLGHCHPVITEAIQRQNERLPVPAYPLDDAFCDNK